jgi:hypothetical protein
MTNPGGGSMCPFDGSREIRDGGTTNRILSNV